MVATAGQEVRAGRGEQVDTEEAAEVVVSAGRAVMAAVRLFFRQWAY